MEEDIKPNTIPPADFSFSELDDVAKNLDVDPDLWVFRRFGKLHLFNLLRLQLDLVTLERKLEKHVQEQQGPRNMSQNMSHREKKKFFNSIHRALSEYDAALEAQAKFKSYRKPNANVMNKLKSWADSSTGDINFYPLRDGLVPPRLRQVYTGELASIAATQKSWVHEFIDNNDCLNKIFKLPPPKMSHGQGKVDRTVRLYSEDDARRAEALFLHLSFCILLMCTISGLEFLQSRIWKLVLLAIALLVASVLCVCFLNSTNTRSLAFLCGFAAILVVYIGS